MHIHFGEWLISPAAADAGTGEIATVIDTERYLLTCMCYIELNPVRAGRVAHPWDYPWSSYLSNAQRRADELVCQHDLYRRLGRSGPERCSAYRQLFGARIGQAVLDAIRQATNNGWALGSARFRQRIEALSQRRAAP